jgi:hypothetical protein
MTPPDVLIQLFKPWNDFYSHSKAMETVVLFMHIGGLLLAGGLAIAADRATLRALAVGGDGRVHQMKELAAVHRWVLTGLTVVVISGVALFTSDIETFFGSWIFWVKMVLVALLLINGFMMTRTERSLETDASDGAPHWGAMRRTAVTSLLLWFVITLAGVALANFA